MAKLVPSDIGPGDMFGRSVHIGYNRAIIGSWSLDGQTGGVAYIFEDNGSGWVQVARLRPSGINEADRFGTSVAINQDMAVVGAPADDFNGFCSGAIYIFWNDGSVWDLEGTLRGSTGDEFGYSVDITWMGGSWPDKLNYRIVAGSPGYNFASGCVRIIHYEFMLNGWRSDRITPSDGAEVDRFGTSVSTPWSSYQKVIIVGAPGDNYMIEDSQGEEIIGEDCGSAYIFAETSFDLDEGGNWEEEAKLTPNDPSVGDEFGKSVGFSHWFSGGYGSVIVGAHLDDDNGLSSGSAYIFQKSGSTWTQVAKLVPSDGVIADIFGRSVSLSRDNNRHEEWALIGAPYDDNYGNYSGSVYVFSTRLDTAIHGTKWHDIDRDGVRDTGDPGLEGWRIYVDENENGQWDEGEHTGITNEDGDYSISNISPGSYVVREELQPGWIQTFPDGSGVHVVNVEVGRINSEVDFGNCSAYIYVDADATGANNGRNWGDAYKYLQDALAKAVSGNEILVADGIYKPDQKSGQTPGKRKATFRLINGVAIKGGYSGLRGEYFKVIRDIDAFKTILSGDLDENDDGFTNNAENSYHVVTGSGTDATAVIDGFTITAGNANDSGTDMGGGGMINKPNGNPTIINCTFHINWAVQGGAIRNFDHSNPRLTNCQFKGNSARRGGGIYNGYYSKPLLINCTFSGNTANSEGGGMFNHFGSDARLINCTLSGNSAGNGGGMCNYYNSPTLTNCILWGNSDDGGRDESAQIYNTNSTPLVKYCCVPGRMGIFGGSGNIGDDPLFLNPRGNLRISPSSPCIDAGDNKPVPSGVTVDLDGHPRIVDGDRNSTSIVDMGAYEFVPRYGN